MDISLTKIKKYFPKFNQTAITEMDFWRAAKKAKIIVRTMPLTVKGYYRFQRGRHYILIDSRLPAFEFLHTALHEFSHFLFDCPNHEMEDALYKGRIINDPRERFADAFALIGLMPEPELMRIVEEDIEDNLRLLSLLKDRIAVRAYYGK